VVQLLFVWVQDVYRPIFVIGLVDWLSCLQPVSVTYTVCVCVRARARARTCVHVCRSFSSGNGSIHFHMSASQSLGLGKYSCAIFLKQCIKLHQWSHGWLLKRNNSFWFVTAQLLCFHEESVKAEDYHDCQSLFLGSFWCMCVWYPMAIRN